MLTRLFLVTVILGTICQSTSAQNLIRDYVKDYPVHYQPDDPWFRGVVFRVQTGHGGLFYNCDQEECKRHSPYLTSRQQPYQCIPRKPVRTTINQQICEVKQRILWGGSGCFSCESPACVACQNCNHCQSGCGNYPQQTGTCNSCRHGFSISPLKQLRHSLIPQTQSASRHHSTTRSSNVLDSRHQQASLLHQSHYSKSNSGTFRHTQLSYGRTPSREQFVAPPRASDHHPQSVAAQKRIRVAEKAGQTGRGMKVIRGKLR